MEAEHWLAHITTNGTVCAATVRIVGAVLVVRLPVTHTSKVHFEDLLSDSHDGFLVPAMPLHAGDSAPRAEPFLCMPPNAASITYRGNTGSPCAVCRSAA
jgi:hypothetical protein